ncbi:unnamed protein product [Mycena citricolor]|uniref:Uncharacterized protein n=1 Tax=Mycena citricolor TaxID=2018698 RepID=A0AAD2HRX1_9AGAR|nr:unnamed protein product [Mycena citricolor]
MPSIMRSILLALQAASLLTLSGLSPAPLVTVNASPLPGASSISSKISPSSLLAPRVLTKHADADLAPRVSPVLLSSLERRQTEDAVVQRFRQYAATATKHDKKFKDLAAKAKTVSPDDKEFPRNARLACFDKNNDIQQYLKIIVNAHKSILQSVVVIVAGIPVLGPLLAPLLYDIKCIVDKILDIVENLIDCLLNLLGPLVQQLLPGVSDLLCQLKLCLL